MVLVAVVDDAEIVFVDDVSSFEVEVCVTLWCFDDGSSVVRDVFG